MTLEEYELMEKKLWIDVYVAYIRADGTTKSNASYTANEAVGCFNRKFSKPQQ